MGNKREQVSREYESTFQAEGASYTEVLTQLHSKAFLRSNTEGSLAEVKDIK